MRKTSLLGVATLLLIVVTILCVCHVENVAGAFKISASTHHLKQEKLRRELEELFSIENTKDDSDDTKILEFEDQAEEEEEEQEEEDASVLNNDATTTSTTTTSTTSSNTATTTATTAATPAAVEAPTTTTNKIVMSVVVSCIAFIVMALLIAAIVVGIVILVKRGQQQTAVTKSGQNGYAPISIENTNQVYTSSTPTTSASASLLANQHDPENTYRKQYD